MIDYGSFAFAAPPRTGSTWFVKAADMAGLSRIEDKGKHKPHPDRWPSLKVSLTRHPVDWLVSYYKAIYPGKIGVPVVDAFADLDGASLTTFAEDYLHKMPGAIGRMIAAYGADDILRVEDFPASFLALVVPMPRRPKFAYEAQIKALPAQNTTKSLVLLDPDLIPRVHAAESAMMDAYNYW